MLPSSEKKGSEFLVVGEGAKTFGFTVFLNDVKKLAEIVDNTSNSPEERSSALDKLREMLGIFGDEFNNLFKSLKIKIANQVEQGATGLMDLLEDLFSKIKVITTADEHRAQATEGGTPFGAAYVSSGATELIEALKEAGANLFTSPSNSVSGQFRFGEQGQVYFDNSPEINKLLKIIFEAYTTTFGSNIFTRARTFRGLIRLGLSLFRLRGRLSKKNLTDFQQMAKLLEEAMPQTVSDYFRRFFPTDVANRILQNFFAPATANAFGFDKSNDITNIKIAAALFFVAVFSQFNKGVFFVEGGIGSNMIKSIEKFLRENRGSEIQRGQEVTQVSLGRNGTVVRVKDQENKGGEDKVFHPQFFVPNIPPDRLGGILFKDGATDPQDVNLNGITWRDLTAEEKKAIEAVWEWSNAYKEATFPRATVVLTFNRADIKSKILTLPNGKTVSLKRLRSGSIPGDQLLGGASQIIIQNISGYPQDDNDDNSEDEDIEFTINLLPDYLPRKANDTVDEGQIFYELKKNPIFKGVFGDVNPQNVQVFTTFLNHNTPRIIKAENRLLGVMRVLAKSFGFVPAPAGSHFLPGAFEGGKTAAQAVVAELLKEAASASRVVPEVEP